MTQIEQIKTILRRDGKINNFYCVDTKLSLRLAMHIDVLKKRGWEFRTYYANDHEKNYVYELIREPGENPKKLEFGNSEHIAISKQGNKYQCRKEMIERSKK